MFVREEYRIQPTEHYDKDEQTTFVGDGVQVIIEIDEQGRGKDVKAYFGRVVGAYPKLPQSPANRLYVRPFNNSEYKFVKAPPNWRELIVEQLTSLP